MDTVDGHDRHAKSGQKTARLLCLGGDAGQSDQNDGKSHASQHLVSVPVWALPQ